MKKIKKTKIIATLGPATSSTDIIKKIIKEGVDVLRINFSHSSHDEAKALIKEIRKINSKNIYSFFYDFFYNIST